MHLRHNKNRHVIVSTLCNNTDPQRHGKPLKKEVQVPRVAGGYHQIIQLHSPTASSASTRTTTDFPNDVTKNFSDSAGARNEAKLLVRLLRVQQCKGLPNGDLCLGSCSVISSSFIPCSLSPQPLDLPEDLHRVLRLATHNSTRLPRDNENRFKINHLDIS